MYYCSMHQLLQNVGGDYSVFPLLQAKISKKTIQNTLDYQIFSKIGLEISRENTKKESKRAYKIAMLLIIKDIGK